MVLQLEDCANIIKVFHPGIYLIILFDHSCGHGKGIEDWSNLMKMNSEYGGEQREMYPTKIIMEDGYISPHA